MFNIHTSIVVGAGVLVRAVLLALSAPFLGGSGCDEEGSSSQRRSSERKHVVMLHNGTIWIANGRCKERGVVRRRAPRVRSSDRAHARRWRGSYSGRRRQAQEVVGLGGVYRTSRSSRGPRRVCNSAQGRAHRYETASDLGVGERWQRFGGRGQS